MSSTEVTFSVPYLKIVMMTQRVNVVVILVALVLLCQNLIVPQTIVI